MAETDFDLVIIGGGPAGLTAGLYAARARMNVILYEKLSPGGQVLTTDWVENYPGFPKGISGADLSREMSEQARHFGLRIESDEVLSLDLSGPVRKIQLSESTVTARAIIIATGASPKRLGIPGEDRFFGKGISSCATCDGPFCKDRVVAAVGGGDTAVQESVFLSKFAKKIYLIHRRDQFRAEKILQERALSNEKIEVLWDTVVTGVSGLTHVEGIHTRNVKSGETKSLKIDTLFVWIGTVPNAGFAGDALKRDEYGFLLTDARMETSVPGVFAVGDVRNTPLRQIATAVGDAAIAAASAEHYIENL
ncbi:MAG: thioredoxin-disulfide reductase [Desulfobacterales bacterium]